MEDNADDVMLTAMAFRKAEAAAKLEVASYGEQAIVTLRNGAGGTPPAVGI